MINWHDTTGTLEGDCPWHDDRVFAELVAKKLDIPLHVVDLSADYRTRVVDYMFSEYEKGRTPNPDVLCNREIKFDVFLREAPGWAPISSPRGTTAARPRRRSPDGRTIYKLLAGTDPNKDQSYFLCQLSQEQLRYALFPVGDLLKPEVRRIAAEQGSPRPSARIRRASASWARSTFRPSCNRSWPRKGVMSTRYSPRGRNTAPRPESRRAHPMPDKQSPPRHPRPPDARTGIPHSPGGQHAADVPPHNRTARSTGRPVALHRPRRQEDRRARRGALLHHRPAQGTRHRRAQGIAVHPRHRHRTERHLCRRRRQPPPACGDRHCISPPARYTGSTPRARCRQAIAPASASASATASPCRRPRSSSATREPTSSSTPPAGHHTRAVRRMVRRRRTGRFGIISE